MTARTPLDIAREDAVARFRSWLKSRNLPATPQRMAIADVVLGAERPLAADEVVARLSQRGPAPGTATVYRTIDSLIASGLVREEDRREGFRRFRAVRDDVSTTELLCTECGAVTPVEDPRAATHGDSIAGEHGFLPVRTRVVVYGRCAACQVRGPAQALGN
ncbi:MAG: transcriptional repressor [Gemmatimonadetes bacterium]|nr:transcriptional repressor [Gemmatimonadota bacterium]